LSWGTVIYKFMNWENYLRGAALVVFLGLGAMSAASPKCEKETETRTKKITLVTDLNSKCLVSSSSRKIFKLEALYDGKVELETNNEIESLIIVTVFSKDFKDVIVQNNVTSCVGSKLGLSFDSEVGEVYYITWDVDEQHKDISWSISQEELAGISPRNAIESSEGLMNVKHLDKKDRWFLFVPSKSGKVCISSIGYTQENTCLFVYGKDFDVTLASSNNFENSMQSKVVLDCKQGEKYYLKWSSAFTSGSYDWSIAYY